ncbi:MAG: HD domain-containing protein [Lachnospiraceae bacterium]|nr:HD domain-containing protein [Lachnospiraceae bacterium]
MYDLIRTHQLNIMLFLCGSCGVMVFLLMITRFLTKSRKSILIAMELIAFFLLWFDRQAYIYAGNPTEKGYVMVRVSNFMVFFLTSAIVFGFNLYLTDLLLHEGEMEKQPRILSVVGSMSALGMVMAVIAAFTDLYYYFDETNTYHRGPGFLIAYIIPVICPLMQYIVIAKNKKAFSRIIYISLNLYIFVPIICGLIQIKAYGISIVNMAMVAVSVSLYIFTYVDINDRVVHMHELQLSNAVQQKERMERLFEQTAGAFVSAVEKKDSFARGTSIRIAEYARRVAEYAGKTPEECEKVFFAALLHDVGLIGIPDRVIKNESDPDKWDQETMHKKPMIGYEILSGITEYPYLAQGARYSHERYNGTGYPDGLKGDQIPEIARIIAVADAYVTMTTKKRYRDAKPDFLAREAFIKGAGESFDPFYADIMVKIIDQGSNASQEDEGPIMETRIECRTYREQVTLGIPVEQEIRKITFVSEGMADAKECFCTPAIILFDAYDQRVHENEKMIEASHYLEYGELWFDQHSISTEARKIEEKEIPDRIAEKRDDGKKQFEIIAGRIDDHLHLIMRSEDYAKEVIVAIKSISNASYIGLTGENCILSEIAVETTGEKVQSGDIPRIVQPVDFTDHLEGDIKNIQVNMPRSASTEGIDITGKMEVQFHAQTLPGAVLVWHCPYIILFYSEDGTVGGPGYLEYNMIKMSGEDQGDGEFARNHFVMERKKEFPGWEVWKEVSKKGIECNLILEKKGDQVFLKTENQGIYIENTTTFTQVPPKVYVALTGDQVALTDIRVNRY